MDEKAQKTAKKATAVPPDFITAQSNWITVINSHEYIPWNIACDDILHNTYLSRVGPIYKDYMMTVITVN